VPMFPTNGHDEWYRRQFGRDFATTFGHVINNRADALAKSLASVYIGTPADKRAFEQEAADCENEDAFYDLLYKRHDEKRTSVVDIGRIAWGLADVAAEKALMAAPAAVV